MILAMVGSDNVYVSRSPSLIDFITNIFIDKEPNIFLSGGARGIDIHSEMIFRKLFPRKEVYIFRPKNFHWEGTGGFKERNLKIAQTCDELVCIRHHKSESFGSGWTAIQAEKLGKKVTRYLITDNLCSVFEEVKQYVSPKQRRDN